MAKALWDDGAVPLESGLRSSIAFETDRGHWDGRAARLKDHAHSASLSRGARGTAVVVFFRPRSGQGRRRRRIGNAGFDTAKHLSGLEDQLRDRARQRALDRLQQSVLVLGAHDAEDTREPDRPDKPYDASDAPSPVVAGKPERRDRCAADGGSQR